MSEEKKDRRIPSNDFSSIFWGGGKKMTLPTLSESEIEAYKKATKIVNARYPEKKISVQLDFTNGSDDLVISHYDDETLHKLGVIVGILLDDEAQNNQL